MAPPFAQFLGVHAASAVAVGVAATTTDFLRAAEAPGANVVAVAGLALPGSAAGGMLLGVAFGMLRRLPRRLAWLIWLAFGLALSGWLSRKLGVWVRLDSPQHELALWALSACVSAGACVAALGIVMQPSAEQPAGLWASRPAARTLTACLMVFAALFALIVDRTVEPGGYPAAHATLRWVSLGAASLALVRATGLTARPLRISRSGVILSLAALFALAAVPLLLSRPQAVRLAHRALLAPYPATMVRLVRAGSDWDRDGHSAVLGGGDCAPFDGAVHPGAREVPGNGVDDNCRLGDAAVTASRETAPPVPAHPAPTSVVLITIEALQARLLSAYGYERSTTPELDRWARDALRFDRAYTTGGWTTLAMSSVFYGRYPRRLHWKRLVETNRYRLLQPPLRGQLRAGEAAKKAFMLPLDDPRRPLQHWLRRRGMRTLAVVDDGYTEVMAAHVGAFADFDRYVEVTTTPDKQNRDAVLTAKAIAELGAAVRARRPFFLWVHYFGTHVPDSQHRGTREFGRGRRARYLHEVAYMDQQLGKLLRALDGAREAQPIAVIVTADHGEVIDGSFRGHGRDLSEEGIRIPLFIAANSFSAGTTPRLASGVDLMPTILALTQTPAPSGLDGVDLSSPPSRTVRRVVLTDTWLIDNDRSFITNQVAALDGERKLIVDRLDMDESLVDQTAVPEREVSEPVPPHLRRALDHYLEDNSMLRVSD